MPKTLPKIYVDAEIKYRREGVNLAFCWNCPVCNILNRLDAGNCVKCRFHQTGLSGPPSEIQPIYTTPEAARDPYAEPMGYLIVLGPADLVEQRKAQWAAAAVLGYVPWPSLDPKFTGEPKEWPS